MLHRSAVHSTRREWQDNLCLYDDEVHDPAGAYDDDPSHGDADSDTYLLLYRHLDILLLLLDVLHFHSGIRCDIFGSYDADDCQGVRNGLGRRKAVLRGHDAHGNVLDPRGRYVAGLLGGNHLVRPGFRVVFRIVFRVVFRAVFRVLEYDI
jgi:hypothetical protein